MSFVKYLKEAEAKKYVNKSGKETDDKSKIEKVIVELKGSEAGKVTKIVNQLQEISDLEKELKQKKEKLKCSSKEICDELFKAEDEVYTRVMETSSVILTISKSTTREKIDYKKALEEMATKLTPDIIKQMNEIIKAFTKTEEVSSTVKGTVKESFKDWMNKGFGFIKTLVDKMKLWGKTYDTKLKDFQKKYGI